MRKGELIFNYSILLMPLVLGLVSAGFIGLYFKMPGSAFWGMVIFFILGFTLFLKAKLSIIRQGRLFTFGPSQMTKSNRMVYFIGYGVMILGLLIMVGFGIGVR